MKKMVLPALAVIMLLSVGCVRKDALLVHEVENISISVRGGTRITAILRVENTSPRNITVGEMDLIACDFQGNEIAHLSTEDPIYIPRRSETSVILPLKVQLRDPVNGLRLLRNLSEVTERVTLTGTAVVKYGAVRKKYELKEIPLSNIISTFGPDKKDMPRIN